MGKEVVAGQACTLGCNIYDMLSIPIKPKVDGTIYAVLQCNGGDNDGLFWGDGRWKDFASISSFPTMQYSVCSFWFVPITAEMTRGNANCEINLVDATDNPTSPADSTVAAGGMEFVSVRTILTSELLATTNQEAAELAAALGNVTKGTCTRKIKVQLAGGEALPDVRVVLYDAGLSTVITALVTGPDGLTNGFNVNPGAYAVKLLKAGHTFEAVEMMTVDADGISVFVGQVVTLDPLVGGEAPTIVKTASTSDRKRTRDGKSPRIKGGRTVT